MTTEDARTTEDASSAENSRTAENSSSAENSTTAGDSRTDGDVGTGTPDDGLVSRLAVIEDQPLESRAAAYSQLLDQLQGRLEGGDVPRSTN